MKNLLKTKFKKFNSKKGFTLIELIVAIMILMIVVSASVRGIDISYRSALTGAAKNDAQSIAQRNCDIIMSAITTDVENIPIPAANVSTLGGMVNSNGTAFTDNKRDDIIDDAKISLPFDGGYNADQYAFLEQVDTSTSTVQQTRANETDPNKKYQYYTISKSEKTIGSVSRQVYHITTYVYYTDTAYVTCEGEVSVLPNTTP